jgi:5-(carboxyamino)imidazole ribonucleotide synthase
MLALAGYPLGFEFRVYDSAPDAPAGKVAPLTVGSFDDHDALARFARSVDLVTYEWESVPMLSVRALESVVPVHPSSDALAQAQDRLLEKTLFRRLGLATPEFEAIGTREELDRVSLRLGYPCVLKTRRFGYDGKGQFVLRSRDDVDRAWKELHAAPGGLILEEFVAFERELSTISVRQHTIAAPRTIHFYPLVWNQHEGGILRTSIAPAPALSPHLQRDAEDAARAVLEALDYVGVLAIEWFQVGDRLLANEMAPRVHNSGHWTIEGSQTSQFENHIRAIMGLPLGAAGMRLGGHAAMLNLIGSCPSVAELSAIPGAHVHLYGKAPREGRKLGHLTLTERTLETLLERVHLARRMIAST